MPRVSAGYLEKRRRQVLEAALRCFAREGFHRTTIQHVVREARLSPGAIYRYFASKEDLIAAIAARRHAAEREMLRRALDGRDVRAGLAALTRAFLGRLADPGEKRWRRVTVQLWAEALRNERVRRTVNEGLEEPLRALAVLIRRGPRPGPLSAADPDALARVGAAIFQGLVLQQAWNPRLDVAAYVGAAAALLDAALAAPSRVRSRRPPRREPPTAETPL
jgi:AcrR family transcriptional regulator